jgi:hypothetical protein
LTRPRNPSSLVPIRPADRAAVLRATVMSCTFCPGGRTSDVGATSPDQCYMSEEFARVTSDGPAAAAIKRLNGCFTLHARSCCCM